MNDLWNAVFHRNQHLDDLRRAEGYSEGYSAACDEILGRIARRMHREGFEEAEIVKALDLPLDTIQSYLPRLDSSAS